MAVLFHGGEPIVGPTEPASSSTLEGFEIGDYVGNPIYSVVDEHSLAAALLLMVPVLAWILVRVVTSRAARGDARATRLVDVVTAVPLGRRLAAALVAVSGFLHVVLAFTHEVTWYTPLYLIGGGLLAWAAWAILTTNRRLPVVLVIGSIVTFWFLGVPPDQFGIVVKLIEVFALLLLAIPQADASRTRRLAPAGTVSLLVLTGLAVWVGAFASVGEDGGHHGGEFPEPGTLVPYIERLDATAAEEHYADDLYWATWEAIEKYRDPAVAEAAGYQVGVVVGDDHHAQNPSLIGDGRILDPEYPESLIYAATDAGPVLVGVMFETDGIGERGPTAGGPIMLWHAHENVCLSVLPLGLAGLESPFGGCPIGSVNLPVTGEMLHAWMMPGIPEEDRWGHVDEEWFAEYLTQLSAVAGGS